MTRFRLKGMFVTVAFVAMAAAWFGDRVEFKRHLTRLRNERPLFGDVFKRIAAEQRCKELEAQVERLQEQLDNQTTTSEITKHPPDQQAQSHFGSTTVALSPGLQNHPMATHLCLYGPRQRIR